MKRLLELCVAWPCSHTPAVVEVWNRRLQEGTQAHTEANLALKGPSEPQAGTDLGCKGSWEQARLPPQALSRAVPRKQGGKPQLKLLTGLMNS